MVRFPLAIDLRDSWMLIMDEVPDAGDTLKTAQSAIMYYSERRKEVYSKNE